MITTETSLKGNTMTTSTELHPWLSTPEATEAARKAIQIPLALLPSLAGRVSTDKLETQALVILTECAMPPRDLPPTECLRCGGSLEDVRNVFGVVRPNLRDIFVLPNLKGLVAALPAQSDQGRGICSWTVFLFLDLPISEISNVIDFAGDRGGCDLLEN